MSDLLAAAHCRTTLVARPHAMRAKCPVCERGRAFVYVMHAPCFDVVECTKPECGAVSTDPDAITWEMPF